MNSDDSTTMTATPSTTGHQALIQYFRPRLLFDTIVGRLAGDDYVVDVTLAQAGAGDAHEMRLLLQLGDASAAHVAHAGAQSADKLEDHRLQRAAVGHASFDALGNELGETVLAGAFALHHALGSHLRAGQIGGALEVALAGALAHGGQRAHAAVALEAAPLVEDGFAGGFVR